MTEPIETEGVEKFTVEDRNTATCARAFVEHRFTKEGRVNLTVWRGEFYGWDGTHWENVDRASIEKAAIEWVERAELVEMSGSAQKREPLGLTASEVKDMVWMIERLHSTRAAREPYWALEGRGGPPFDLDHSVAFLDRVVDVRATAEHRRAGGTGFVTHPATPDLFTTNTLRVRWNPDARCPRWERCGREWSKEQGPEHFELIERVGGKALTNDRTLRRWFHQYGRSDCGKGILTNTVLKGLFPSNAFDSKRMKDLFDQFALDGLQTARCFLITEAGHLDRGPGHDVASLVKTLIGDMGRINIKHVRALRNVHFQCAVFVQSNGPLNLPNDHGAMAGKAVIIPYLQSFHDRPDLNLHRTLTDELEGIAVRLVDAAVRVEMEQEVGRKFPVLPEAKKILDEYVADTNPFDLFLDWGFVKAPNFFTPHDMVRRIFREWEQERGRPCRVLDGRMFRDDALGREIERRSSWNVRYGRRASDDTYGLYGISPKSQ